MTLPNLHRYLSPLPPGPFSREEADVVINTWHNVTLENEDPQTGAFRLVIRHHDIIVWQTLNTEPEAGLWMSVYLARYGVRRP